jgi:aspartyl-tRNA(Asn)/glutamyl-tRNA(Gln) amidotransferase subunit C
VADLAKIKLTPDEIEKYTKDLNAIVEYAETLKKVDITGVEPMFSPNVHEGTPLRQDAVKVYLTQSEALSGSNEVEAGHFRVPRTVEGQ